MMTTEEYYEKLYQYIKETPLLVREDEAGKETRNSISELLIPAVSYYIAVCPENWERILNFADLAWEQDEEGWKQAYETSRSKYEIPGLLQALSKEGQEAYRTMAAICTDWGQASKKLTLSLLHQGYPESVTQVPYGISAALMIRLGMYYSYDVGASYLSFMIQDLKHSWKRESEIFGEFMIYDYVLYVAEHMRLPGWKYGQKEVDPNRYQLPGWCRKQILKTHHDEIDEWLTEFSQNQKDTYENFQNGSITIRADGLKDIEMPVVNKDENGPGNELMNMMSVTGYSAITERLSYKPVTSGSLLQFALSTLLTFGVNTEELIRNELSPEEFGRLRGLYQTAFHSEKEPNENYMALGAILIAAAKRMLSIPEAVEEESDPESISEPEPEISQEPAPSAPDKEKEKLQKELESYKEKCAALCAAQAKAEAEGNRAKARLESEIQELKTQRTALEQEIDEILSADDGQEEEPETDLLSALSPFTFAFIGGHDSWQNSMREVFPHARYIPYMDFKACYAGAFSGVDLAIISAKFNKHALTMCAKKAMPEGLPVLYVNTSNQERTMRAIAGRLRKMGMI